MHDLKTSETLVLQIIPEAGNETLMAEECNHNPNVLFSILGILSKYIAQSCGSISDRVTFWYITTDT